MANLADKFKPRFKRNIRIEEEVGKMKLCFYVNDERRYISLEHGGETYAFVFDYKTNLNHLYTQIRKRVKKMNQEPTPGFENFTWRKSQILISTIEKYKHRLFSDTEK